MMVAVLAFGTNVASAQPRSQKVPVPSPSATNVASPFANAQGAAASPSQPPVMPVVEPAAAPVLERPATAPVATHLPASSLPIDGAYSLPGGVWKCETLANTSATSVYRLTDRTHIEEKTMLRLPKRPPVELDTSFEFDQGHGVWKLSMQKGAYLATAPVWDGATWSFKGIESDADPHRVVRLVYTSLGPDAYRSDYEAQNHGNWETFSGATCKRQIP